jgi:hypothetical protein
MDSALQVKVSVNAVNYNYHDEEGEQSSWHMVFDIEIGELSCTFDATEPYLISLTQWHALAQGQGRVDLYCGNGEQSISAKGEYYEFIAVPSGAGGDVDLCVKVPRTAVSKLLDAALDDAVASGHLFAK